MSTRRSVGLLDEYEIEFKLRRSLPAGENLVVHVSGEIERVDDDAAGPLLPDHSLDDGRHARNELVESAAGRVYCLILRASAARSRSRLWDACDEDSATAEEYCSFLFPSDSLELRSEVVESVGDPIERDILVLDTVEVHREHRGHGLGLAAAYEAIDLFGRGCGLVICEPVPLQFRFSREEHPEWWARMRAETLPRDKALAIRKIRKHWSRLGFTRIGRSRFFAINLEYQMPARADLGIGWAPG